VIEEEGIVTEIREDYAYVEVQRSAACEGCDARCSISDSGGQRMQVRALNEAGAYPDDRVKLAISERSFLRGSFLIYILPVLFLVIGAVLGERYGQAVLGLADAQAAAALVAVAFLALGLVVVAIGSMRLSRREEYIPRVVEVLHGPSPCEREPVGSG